MLQKLLLAAMAAFVVFIACLIVVLGGCQRRQGSGARCPAPAVTVKKHNGHVVRSEEIGGDNRRFGRLEDEATVKARIYYADGGETDPEKVRLLPGTWLVPDTMFPLPEERSEP